MNKVKNAINILLVIILSIFAITQLSLAEGHEFEDNLTLDQMLQLSAERSEKLINADAAYLTTHYATGFGLYVGRTGNDAWYGEARYFDCLNDDIRGNGIGKKRGYDVVNIIDIRNDGSSAVTTNGVTTEVTNESDKTIFYKLGVLAQQQIHSATPSEHVASWLYHQKIFRDKYGIKSHNVVQNLSSIPEMERIISNYGGKLKDGMSIRLFIMRVGVMGTIDNGYNRTGQERVYITEGPGDPHPGILRLIKVKKDTDVRLPKVHFVIKRTSKDKEPNGYIQVVDLEKNEVLNKETLTGVGKDFIEQKKWELKYTQNKEEATEFVTDDKGEIYIFGLMSGTYEAEEIENENYGYKIETNPTTFSVSPGTETESKISIDNKDILIDLELIKKDMITGATIKGAGFKIQYMDTGEWVKDAPDEEHPEDRYTDEANAQEYTTDENGIVRVTRLKPGKYRWVETTFPENPTTGGIYKALDRDANGIVVEGKEGEKVTITALDKPVGLFRKIIKDCTPETGIEGVPFEFREKDIKQEYQGIYPELFNESSEYYHGVTVGSDGYCSEEGHCEIKLCDCEDKSQIIRQATKDTPALARCTKHGITGSPSAVQQHVNEWMKKRDEYNELATKVNKIHQAREEGRKKVNEEPNNITDKDGYIDISPLVPDDDDGKGIFEVREIDEGMRNPYFNNDHPDWDSDFNYIGKKIIEDERRRMDIEGLVWVDREDSKDSNNIHKESKDRVWDGGEQDHLLYPVEICLRNDNAPNGGLIGQGVITQDGRYRIRVGGPEGEDLKWVSDPALNKDTYIEFTYNGIKYQSVWQPTLENEENGSKAIEKAQGDGSRAAYNEQFKTIVSGNGLLETNYTEDGSVEINYEPQPEEKYKRRVKYEGVVEGLFDGSTESGDFGGRDSDPIGNGYYAGLKKMPKANEVDPETKQLVSNEDPSRYSDNCYKYSSKTAGLKSSGVNKYQITATTKEAGYKGIESYTVKQDKIEHINLGVYERQQPDISVVNDIESVQVQMNQEVYFYQYGGKAADLEKDNFTGGLDAKFRSNITYKYKRYVKPEQIQIQQEKQNTKEEEKDPFKIKVYYKTYVKNESSDLQLLPEMRTQYDIDYQDIEDATIMEAKYNGEKEIVDKAKNHILEMYNEKEDGKKLVSVNWKKEEPRTSNYQTGTDTTNKDVSEKYNYAYGMLSEPLEHGETAVFYTAYTLTRDQLKGLLEGQDSLEFFNNIETNAYTTRWNEQERIGETGTDAYAGIDKDSVAGNSKPILEYVEDEEGGKIPDENSPELDTFEDDNDMAPTFRITKFEPSVISGNVFYDIANINANLDSLSNKERNRKAGELEAYLGDGINGDGDIAVRNVKVELVELDNNGNEILEDNGETKVLTYEWKGPEDAKEDPKKAITVTSIDDQNPGYYEFKGFIPGEYIVKFTWGKDTGENGENSFYVDPSANDPYKYKTTYAQQYKSTTFNDTNRFEEMTKTPERNRWYLVEPGSSNDYRKKSNAIDDMTLRNEIDSQTLNTGNNISENNDFINPNPQEVDKGVDNENMLTYPDLEEDDVFGGREKVMISRTPAFDVGLENLNSDSDEKITIEKDKENIYQPINIDGLDFGITTRPKQQLDLEKRIERVKVELANGETIVDTSVDYDDSSEDTITPSIKGETKNVTYPKYSVEERQMGIFKMEIDKEILQGSTIEITYRYNIINESELDYVVDEENEVEDIGKVFLYEKNKEKNQYYKFGIPGTNNDINGSEVELSPRIIIDYLDNSMGWKKYPENNAPRENDLWEEITEKENFDDNGIKNDGPVSKLLYNGRFNDGNILYNEKINNQEYNNYHNSGGNDIKSKLENIYALYRTILRDTTNKRIETLKNNTTDETLLESLDKAQIKLKAKEENTDDVKFVASKQLSDTKEDLNFYNSVEIAQIYRTGGAIPESAIPGDSDPTSAGHSAVSSTSYTETVEHDGGWASVVTITDPTGDSTNYNYIVWASIGIVGLSILGVGTMLIRKIVVPSTEDIDNNNK